MPRANPIISSFTGGELSPRLYGRVDTAKYANAGKTVENFICLPHGGLAKRPGSKFMWLARNNEHSRMIRFTYGDTQNYMLVFSPLRIRIFTNSGIVTEAAQAITNITNTNPPVVTYVGADNYANNNRIIISGVVGMLEINNREYTVANVNAGANAFELSGIDATGYTAYASGGTVSEIVEVTTTYTADEIDDLDIAQNANTLFILHGAHPPATLTRTSDTAWTLADTTILRGPWRTLNNDETVTIVSDAETGAAATLTSSAALFNTGMVGAKFKLYTPSRTVGETEFGPDQILLNGDFWSFNGQVYLLSGSTGASNSSAVTPPTHQQGTIRLYHENSGAIDAEFIHKGYGIVTITAFTDTTHVESTVYEGYGYNELPAQMVSTHARFKSATKFWQEGAWSTYRGWPSKITFFEQRAFMANTPTDQQTVYGSVSGVYNDFEEGALDDNALNYTIGSEQVDVIRWMIGGKVLRIGTTSGEYILSSSSQNEAVTPTNIRISRETSNGSSPMRPVTVGNAVVFGQRNGDVDNPARIILEQAYNFDTNSFVSIPLNIWSDHITGEGVIEAAYQAQPDSLIWFDREDGRMCAVTYQRDQDVVAWHRHYLGGYRNAGKTQVADIENIATMPGSDGDELWMLVQRYINGATVRYVEKLSHWDDYVNKEDGIFVDSAITYSGVATSVITGLHHLEGETVSILANGNKLPDQVVTNFRVTVPAGTTKAQIGLSYTATLASLDLEAGAAGGTAQGRAGIITNITLRIHRSLGGQIGPDANSLKNILYRTPGMHMDTSPTLKTGDIKNALAGGWGDKREFVIQHSEPYSFQLLAAMPEVSTSG